MTGLYILIFSVGLLVSLVVGSALAAMIVAKNRALEAGESPGIPEQAQQRRAESTHDDADKRETKSLQTSRS